MHEQRKITANTKPFRWALCAGEHLASAFTVATNASSKANAAATLAKAQPQQQATAAATPAPVLIAAGSNYGHCWRLFLQLWHVRVAP